MGYTYMLVVGWVRGITLKGNGKGGQCSEAISSNGKLV